MQREAVMHRSGRVLYATLHQPRPHDTAESGVQQVTASWWPGSVAFTVPFHRHAHMALQPAPILFAPLLQWHTGVHLGATRESALRWQPHVRATPDSLAAELQAWQSLACAGKKVLIAPPLDWPLLAEGSPFPAPSQCRVPSAANAQLYHTVCCYLRTPSHSATEHITGCGWL